MASFAGSASAPADRAERGQGEGEGPHGEAGERGSVALWTWNLQMQQVSPQPANAWRLSGAWAVLRTVCRADCVRCSRVLAGREQGPTLERSPGRE